MAIPPPPTPAPPPPQNPLTIRRLVKFLLITISCSLFYIIGSYSTITTAHSVTSPPPPCNFLQLKSNRTENNHIAVAKRERRHLDFASHHTFSLPIHTTEENHQPFPYCPRNFTDYCPCHDPITEKPFIDPKRFQKERHCPEKGQLFFLFLFPFLFIFYLIFYALFCGLQSLEFNVCLRKK